MKLKVQQERWDLMISFIKGNYIADFGAEEGEFHDYLMKTPLNNFKRIRGYDNNPKLGSLNHKIDFDEPLPIMNETFDTVILGYILEHVYHPFEFLKECFRVLKKDGRVIITIPNMSSLPYFLNENKDKGVHIHGWNLPMMEHYLQKVGFKVIFKKKINAWYNRNYLFRFLCWIVPNWKACIILVGKK